MAKDLDEQVEAFRTRPLDDGPYTFVAADALTMKVREGGRVVKVAVMVATGVNAEGTGRSSGSTLRQPSPAPAGCRFFRDLVARGLTSRRRPGHLRRPRRPGRRDRRDPAGGGLAAVPHPLRREPDVGDPEELRGAGSRRCCTRVYDQPDAAAVHAQFDRVLDALNDKLPQSRAPRGRPRGHPRVHRLPEGDLASDLVQQPQRTAQPGDPPPHRRRRHLPEPRRDHPPGRRRPGRTTRRMGRATPLPRPRRPDAGHDQPDHHRPPGGQPPRHRRRDQRLTHLKGSPTYTTTQDLTSLK